MVTAYTNIPLKPNGPSPAQFCLISNYSCVPSGAGTGNNCCPFSKHLIYNEVVKEKPTPELKNIKDHVERERVLRDAFGLAGKVNLNNKNVLLIDDLYRSGATLKAITAILHGIGNVKNVFVLTLTKTRSVQ